MLFEKVRKHCEKRRKCWLPAFSPFPTMFSKGFFLGVDKSQDCVVKGKYLEITWGEKKKENLRHGTLGIAVTSKSIRARIYYKARTSTHICLTGNTKGTGVDTSVCSVVDVGRVVEVVQR